jgi:hypothetical protein
VSKRQKWTEIKARVDVRVDIVVRDSASVDLRDGRYQQCRTDEQEGEQAWW